MGSTYVLGLGTFGEHLHHRAEASRSLSIPTRAGSPSSTTGQMTNRQRLKDIDRTPPCRLSESYADSAS